MDRRAFLPTRLAAAAQEPSSEPTSVSPSHTSSASSSVSTPPPTSHTSSSTSAAGTSSSLPLSASHSSISSTILPSTLPSSEIVPLPSPTSPPSDDPNPNDPDDQITSTLLSVSSGHIITITSVLSPASASPSPSSTNYNDSSPPFFQNPPLMGFVFGMAGLVGLALVIGLSTMALRRGRRRREAFDAALAEDPDHASGLGLGGAGADMGTGLGNRAFDEKTINSYSKRWSEDAGSVAGSNLNANNGPVDFSPIPMYRPPPSPVPQTPTGSMYAYNGIGAPPAFAPPPPPSHSPLPSPANTDRTFGYPQQAAYDPRGYSYYGVGPVPGMGQGQGYAPVPQPSGPISRPPSVANELNNYPMSAPPQPSGQEFNHYGHGMPPPTAMYDPTGPAPPYTYPLDTQVGMPVMNGYEHPDAAYATGGASYAPPPPHQHQQQYNPNHNQQVSGRRSSLLNSPPLPSPSSPSSPSSPTTFPSSSPPLNNNPGDSAGAPIRRRLSHSHSLDPDMPPMPIAAPLPDKFGRDTPPPVIAESDFEGEFEAGFGLGLGFDAQFGFGNGANGGGGNGVRESVHSDSDHDGRDYRRVMDLKVANE